MSEIDDLSEIADLTAMHTPVTAKNAHKVRGGKKSGGAGKFGRAPKDAVWVTQSAAAPPLAKLKFMGEK